MTKPRTEILAMEMLRACEHPPPTTDNPIPSQNVCGDVVWGAAPRRVPCLEHLPVGRGPGPTIPGAPPPLEPHRVSVPLSLPQHRDGAELRLCGVWIWLHLCPPSLDLPLLCAHKQGGFSANEALRTRNGRAGFLGWKNTKMLIPRLLERASTSLALHGEQAPAMPPSLPKATPGTGTGLCGPQAGTGCHSPWGRGAALPDSHAAGQSPGGSAAPVAAGLGLRLRLVEHGGSGRWRLRCLSGQSHPFPCLPSLPAKPGSAAAASPARKPPWESLGTRAQRDG